MFFIYIVSMMSQYTLQINKQLLLSDQPTENTEIINTNIPPKMSTKNNVSNRKKTIRSEETKNQDIDNQDNILQWKNDEDYSNKEIYEEIVFQDDFDKEYWNDVDSNYQDE